MGKTAKGRKPGRPRRVGADRYPGGQTKHRDNGPTPEQRLRRKQLTGKGDNVLAEYPLGILYANEQIDDFQRQAGTKFAWLYAVVIGKASVAATQYEGGMKGKDLRDPDDPDYQDWLAKREADWASAKRALCDLSRQHYDAVLNVCVYERMPRFLTPSFPRETDVREAQRVWRGLEELRQVFRIGERVAA